MPNLRKQKNFLRPAHCAILTLIIFFSLAVAITTWPKIADYIFHDRPGSFSDSYASFWHILFNIVNLVLPLLGLATAIYTFVVKKFNKILLVSFIAFTTLSILAWLSYSFHNYTHVLCTTNEDFPWDVCHERAGWTLFGINLGSFLAGALATFIIFKLVTMPTTSTKKSNKK